MDESFCFGVLFGSVVTACVFVFAYSMGGTGPAPGHGEEFAAQERIDAGMGISTQTLVTERNPRRGESRSATSASKQGITSSRYAGPVDPATALPDNPDRWVTRILLKADDGETVPAQPNDLNGVSR